MGKKTLYHPVSLHVLRGAAEYCGWQFGRLQQTKSDPTGLSATYKADIVKFPKHVQGMALSVMRYELQNCFNHDIRVAVMTGDSNGKLYATIVTRIFRDEHTLPLPEPEIHPIS